MISLNIEKRESLTNSEQNFLERQSLASAFKEPEAPKGKYELELMEVFGVVQAQEE
jgi:beta-galactosidase beta subunit